MCLMFIVFGFPMFSTLELRKKINGPQIRILREISSLELAPKVWKMVMYKLYSIMYINLQDRRRHYLLEGPSVRAAPFTSPLQRTSTPKIDSRELFRF